MKKSVIFSALFLMSLGANAQSVVFPDDSVQRGWYDRPYVRYEAEPGKCTSNGTFLEPCTDQRQVQSEASNHQALVLFGKGDSVNWVADAAGNGLTLRFSLPDSEDGNGLRSTVAVLVNGVEKARLTLDSYWAWQWGNTGGGTIYPDNKPGKDRYARMRFDEVHTLLPSMIRPGDIVCLCKVEDDAVPCTIDFIETEPVARPRRFSEIKGPKVRYDMSEGPLADFIAANGGKTIFIPEGRYECDRRIIIPAENTRIVGAGMWYTEIFFSASSDVLETYSDRGISCSYSNCGVDGIYLNTINNKRYYLNDDRYQVGKAFMGNWGSCSSISNVWAEHFECGGWISGTDRLTITSSRFRNNYADGMNLDFGGRNSTVSHCSFRNNGDDEMASWSRGGRECEHICFEYCTAEHNWRASSLAFFGGKNHVARNIVILDPMEAGLRATCDFPGAPFSSEGEILYENISIYRGGCPGGPLGQAGDILSGKMAGAIHLTSYRVYDLKNITLRNIDIYDAKGEAVVMDSAPDRRMENIRMDGIFVHQSGGEGTNN